MYIDLRKEYIHNQFETNMSLFCDKEYRLVYFFYKNMKYKIPLYHEKSDGIYIQYFDREIILPSSLTVYKI
jgi:hypothetical protein